MERILNEDDKIRRAEEIYNRRNNKTVNLFEKSNSEKKRYIGSKIGFEILILINLTIVIFCIQNKENIFKEEFIQKIMSYENIINLNLKKIINSETETNKNINFNEITNNINDTELETEQKTIEENVLVPNTEIVSSLSQMDIDVENLKNSYKFVKPVERSSKFKFWVKGI